MRFDVIGGIFTLGQLLIAMSLIVADSTGAEPDGYHSRLIFRPADPPNIYNFYGNSVQEVAFSPDMKTLAAASYDGHVRLFDLPAGRLRAVMTDPKHPFYSVAFSPDGKSLAYGGWDGMLRDMESGQSSVLSPGLAWVHAVAFSPDGQRLAIGSYLDDFHVRDLATGKSIGKFDPFAGTAANLDKGLYKPTVERLAFSPDGRMLAAHIDFFDDELPRFDHMQIWDVSTQKLVTAFKGASCLFTPDGQTLIYGTQGKIRLWNCKSQEVVATLEDKISISPGALSRDGSTLAAIGHDKTIQIWNLPDRKRVSVLKGDERAIKAIAISSDGKLLASGSDDGSIRLWMSVAP